MTRHEELPIVVQEALRLAERIEAKYPSPLEREEAQDALVQLARFVREASAVTREAVRLAAMIVNKDSDVSELIAANLREIGGFLNWLDDLDVVAPGDTASALQALVNAKHYLDLLVKATA